MKFIYCIPFVLLTACGGEPDHIYETDKSDSLVNNSGSEVEVGQDISEETTTSLTEEVISEIGKRVFYANVGIYGSPAILVLDVKAPDEVNGDGDFSEVEGYYFYVKRQKNLDLKGGFDIINQEFRLTESYKGKTTGFFSFSLADPTKNYWATSEEDNNHQDLNVTELEPIDSELQNFTFSMEKHVYEHEVMDMSAETETWEEVEDNIGVVFINNNLLAFNLSVVRTNFHSGSAAGLAKKIDENTYVWYGEEGCELTIKLSPSTIETIDNGCDYYHGFRATLDADFDR